MDKQEFKKQLLHKRMECKGKLEILRFIGVERYKYQVDELLDMINEIDRILEELDKK